MVNKTERSQSQQIAIQQIVKTENRIKRMEEIYALQKKRKALALQHKVIDDQLKELKPLVDAAIKEQLAMGNVSQQELASIYGVSQPYVSALSCKAKIT